jgi:hypothetical protein
MPRNMFLPGGERISRIDEESYVDGTDNRKKGSYPIYITSHVVCGYEIHEGQPSP